MASLDIHDNHYNLRWSDEGQVQMLVKLFKVIQLLKNIITKIKSTNYLPKSGSSISRKLVPKLIIITIKEMFHLKHFLKQFKIKSLIFNKKLQFKVEAWV
jgi:hypothetical protein